LGYPRTFLFASQKNYIVLLTDFIAKFVLIVSQIIVLIYTQNYVAYLLLVTISNTATNVVIRRIYYKKYSYLKNNKAKIDPNTRRQILNTVKYLSISTLISVGVFGTDNLIISSILGVTVVGFYSNYSMIIQQISLLFTSLLNGVVASLGNMIAEGDNVKINNIFNIYDFAYYLVASFTAVSLYILFNVFISDIWLDPAYLLNMKIVAVIVLNCYLTFKRQPIWQYQNVAGIFKEFLPYSIMELIINLSVSIILAYKIGLIGVFLGTTSAYLCSWLGQIYVVHKHVLNKNHFKYYGKQVMYLLITVFEIVIVLLLDKALIINNIWLHFIYLLVLCAIVPNGINLLLFHKTKEFMYLKEKVLNKIIRKDKEVDLND
jgi:O-antigen/teichoic acid export membrane protein